MPAVIAGAYLGGAADEPEPTGAIFGVQFPKPDSVAQRDAVDVRRIQKLPDIFRLPPRTGHGVALQAMEVDHMDAADPTRGRAHRIAFGNVEMAEIQVLMKPMFVVEQSSQARHFGH